jgi:probable rRNA maturation factor
MAILIDNRHRRVRVCLSEIRKNAQVILNALGSAEAELSIVLVDDADITLLNQRFLNRQGPTNVIAFPMRAGAFADLSPQLLGDVVISVDTAEMESREAGMALQQRLDELLVHGILHLMGYDHEKDAAGAQAMEEKATALMALLGSDDP